MPRFCALLLACLLAGCGSPERPFTDNSKDPESYARDVKRMAIDCTDQAQRSREPADQLQILVTELESQESGQRPLGTYKPIYDELLTASKSLLDDCKKANGKPANLSTRLAAIKKTAEKLPGELPKRG